MMQHVNVDRDELRRVARPALAIILALAGGSLLAFVLETWLGLDDASSVYLVAVAAVAIGFGTVPAVITAAGSFLVYNFLFVEPRFSLFVAGPQELLTLLLLLGLGVLVARLAGMQRDRAAEAARREGEARALFAMSRLFSSEALEPALRAAVQRVAVDARMDRVWVGLGAAEGAERVVAASRDGAATAIPATYALLRRGPDEGHAEWARIHQPAGNRQEPGEAAYRIELSVGGERLGSLWAVRDAARGAPHLEETRLLAAAADQVGLAIQRDRLARQAVDLEVARRSDELKSALLVSVSHDLRTPLAAIRAAAGTLADADVELPAAERRSTATAIDEEAQRLNRLVSNLIDMSRIEGRDLAPDLEAIPVAEAIESVLERMRPLLGARPVVLDVPVDLPPLRADATLLDQVLANLLENVARHTPAGTPLRIRASQDGEGVEVSIADAGSGVPDEALPRLFDRFYRSAGSGDGGSGLGLAVVRGFVEAMGGHVSASSERGRGLKVTLHFAAHPAPAHEAARR
jgi:two-component system sensor histidine kinase KdpD